jgi:phospholipid/cholesterol/gamma-HCH transport system substrate-binding protein
MTARRFTPLVIALAALVVLVLLITGNRDDSRYRFKMELSNALGLRDGSLVTVGGVQVGTVKVHLDAGHDDKVLVEGILDKGKGPIGKGARAYINSVNLLGQKRLEVDKGNLATPMPSGSVIPGSRVTPSTDLDQVLAVLTPDVRSRLNILLNEAGAATVGRGTDMSKLISTLPSTIDKATALVDGVVTDNHTLGDLVDHSDKLVTEVTRERAALGDVIDSAGQASTTVAAKRAQLRATLADAPGTLATLQCFLGQLEATTVPLGPAARDITKVAPQLLKTVDEIAPFQRAAAPALDKATEVAPSLTKLATGAIPVLTRATPTVKRLATFAVDLVPVTDTLDRSVDNLIGTVDNWSRAVQYRDGLSHIFRGEAAVTPQTLELVLNRYLGAATGTAKKTTPAARLKAPAAKSPSLPIVSGSKPKLPQLKLPDLVPAPIRKTLDDTVGTVNGLLNGLAGRQPQKEGAASPSPKPFLDFLLNP